MLNSDMSKTFPATKLPVGKVASFVLVCGDPQRATLIAEQFDDVVLINDHREFRAYSGTFEGRVVTVCAHGIGAPGAAIAFEELIAAGAKYLIRIGTCGGIQPDIQSGDLIVATAAVDNTGYGRQTVPEGYPAVANVDVALALRQSAQDENLPVRTGLIVTCDNFYAGVTTPFTPNYQLLSQARVLAVEMECSALFLVGSLRGVKTGAILAVDGNVLGRGERMDTYEPHRELVQTAVNNSIRIALNSMKLMEPE
jgi:uridine phosphorylase